MQATVVIDISFLYPSINVLLFMNASSRRNSVVGEYNIFNEIRIQWKIATAKNTGCELKFPILAIGNSPPAASLNRACVQNCLNTSLTAKDKLAKSRFLVNLCIFFKQTSVLKRFSLPVK